MPDNHFFGEPDGEGGSRGLTVELRHGMKTCLSCPVRAACLEYAITHHIRYGIWGGTTQQDRRMIIRARIRARRKVTA